MMRNFFMFFFEQRSCASFVQAKLAITKNCEAVVQHAMARRLRFIPIEVLPREEALSRYEAGRFVEGYLK
jgi:hypothetical protein